jgi:hypothetical protein
MATSVGKLGKKGMDAYYSYYVSKDDQLGEIPDFCPNLSTDWEGGRVHRAVR